MNKTIVLILCKKNNKIVFKYSTDQIIYASTYKIINNKKILHFF